MNSTVGVIETKFLKSLKKLKIIGKFNQFFQKVVFANFRYVIFVNFHYFVQKKKKDFFDYQPFVCPCAVHCDSEHKQINLYLDKNFCGQLLYATLNQKELGELLHCFCNENKKKCGFCDDYDKCIYCKKLKYIRQRLDNAYYFSP